MEVPGARRAVSEEDEDRLLLAPQFHGPSDADRMRQLRADRGRDREIVPLPVDVMARHLMPFDRSEEHTSELQSLTNLVCRLLLEKKKKQTKRTEPTKQQARQARNAQAAYR